MAKDDPRAVTPLPRTALGRIRAAQAGDVAAFEEIYRENVGRVYALSVRLMASGADSEIVTQDVFVKAWERLETFRGESAFSTWLHHICVNLVLMHHRATARRTRRVEITDDLERLDFPDTERLPDVGMDLERAIAALPRGARMVFVLHDVEGHRHAEIAALLGIRENTSKAHLHRARKLLREVLDDHA